jgi:two-component system, chemotaxis family, response regulator Rcp1
MGSGVVVLVEDDPADVELVRLALKRSQLHVRLHVLADGESAIRHITACEELVSTLYLVDLNLPRRSGFEVLEAIREVDSRALMEAIAMSSSTTASEQARALALGAKQFIGKPGSVEELDELGCQLAAALGRLQIQPAHHSH